MTEYRLRARSATPGDYNFIAGRVAFLAAAADVKSGVDIGDGTQGIYDPVTGQFSDPGKANVLLGHDYLFSGVNQIAELDYNEASRNTDPGIANVWYGITYKIANVDKTGTKRASSITNLTANNIKKNVVIDNIIGTYDPSTGQTTPAPATTRTGADVFSNALSDIFASTIAVAATFTPAGGSSIGCSVIVNRSVLLQPSGMDTQVYERGTTIEVQLSEIGAEPNRGDVFVVGTETFTVQSIDSNDGDTVVAIVT